MAITRIHKGKQPRRPHFIQEWAEKRGWGTKLGIQHYRNDGDDPADPVFVAIPVNYSSRLPLSTEVPDGGKTELSILVSDCPWRSPIILLNIISARSMVRIAPKVARALLIDASAMNT